jgi:hypothetical protein
MKILEYKHFNTLISISILIVCLLILFNFVSILDNAKISKETSKVSGFSILNNSETNKTGFFGKFEQARQNASEEELKSIKMKTLFIMITIVLGVVITNLMIIIFLLRKDRLYLESLE